MSRGLGDVYKRQVRAVIDGQEYYYDATPWEGGYKNWDYIQLDKY